MHLPTDAVPAGPDTLAGMLGSLFTTILSPAGIDAQMAVALIFGFVAKEVVVGALAVIYGATGSALTATIGAQMDWVQAYSFMLFTLLYTPCLSTIATLRSESRSLLYTTATVVWGLVAAWVVSTLFYQAARWLGY